MPELPEVQTVVDDLINEQIIGTGVVNADLFWQKTIARPSPIEFCQQILGQAILHIERRGKYILIKLTRSSLLIHLRMSGRLLLEKSSEPHKHERVRLTLSDGRVIRFIDQRKFGRFYLLEDASEILNQLGTDPLSADFTPHLLMQLLDCKTKIKSLLLNQKIISGIGNIYADEALWEAKIHPETPSGKIQPNEAVALCLAIKKVLNLGVINRGTSLGKKSSNFHALHGQTGTNVHELRAYQREGSPCARCHTSITKIKLNGRSTHLCEHCQLKN